MSAEIERLLDVFEAFEVDMSAYLEEPTYARLVHGEIRGNARSLVHYLGKLELDTLRNELRQLDVDEVGIVEFLESVRGYIIPEAREALARRQQSFQRTTGELISDIEAQKQLMIAVATGGPRIDSVNDEYIERRERIAADLTERGVPDPNPFSDLWKWYGKWSGEIPGYQPRREYIVSLYEPLLHRLRIGDTVRSPVEPTGWERVDREATKIQQSLRVASHEEDFQSIGMQCRELLISLAQEVFEPDRHPTEDGVDPSKTDANRMLAAYIAVELRGKSDELTRRHAKAALALANGLTHTRTASFRMAALCTEATLTMVNVIAIVADRRDP